MSTDAYDCCVTRTIVDEQYDFSFFGCHLLVHRNQHILENAHRHPCFGVRKILDRKRFHSFEAAGIFILPNNNQFAFVCSCLHTYELQKI